MALEPNQQPASEQTPQGEQQQQTTQGDNPPQEENQLLNQTNIWQNPESKPANGEQQQQQTQQQQPAPDTGAQLQEYINGLDFTQDIPDEAITSLMDERNPKAFATSINSMMQQMYRSSLSDMSRMINGSLESFERKMTGMVNQTLAKNKSIDSLASEFDFASNPNLAPIAQGVKAQALKMGKTDAEANAFVKQFFTETAQLVGNELGDENPNLAPGRGGFNNTGTQSGDVDWGEILGKPG